MGMSLNPTARLAIAIAFATLLVAAGATNNSFNLKPFKIDLAGGIPRLKSLVNSTRLPAKVLYPDAAPTKGSNWKPCQAKLNQLEHFTAVIEGQTVHFVHEKSKAVDAIPVMLLHGWPGSFQEFLPVIEPLTQPSISATRKTVSFNVVVPSLPGFVFSSAPPENWTVDDTARIFNTLMTEVLGYSTYAVHGTDWGSSVVYSLYSSFNTTVRAAHFAFLPFFPPGAQDIAENNITLSDIQKVTEQRAIDWNTTGNGYDIEKTTKPNDNDSPVGQLAWIGGKFKLWSDPRAGTPPSVLTNTAILTSVTLYYLTQSFLSSVWIYAQNPNFFKTVYTKAPTDAPLLFSQYKYNVALWPVEYVAKVGNLVSYKVYDFGGHFAGLDNPPSGIEDIRDVGRYLLD
ncbi:Alpha/Beta hydrolase protein [Mycena rebaudengoi]|nr:Alpha/Beta hydrolase protein [Mycena rebaudengoi]